MDYLKINRHNERCAEALRTLELFIANAEQQHETKIPISTLKLILDSVVEVDDGNNL
jgi:hypothetical protein